MLVAFTVLGKNSGKISAVTQDFRQPGFAPDMHHDKNGSLEILRQFLIKLAESIDSASRRADNDNVVFGHRERSPS
jgi:hypothetical protein